MVFELFLTLYLEIQILSLGKEYKVIQVEGFIPIRKAAIFAKIIHQINAPVE